MGEESVCRGDLDTVILAQSDLGELWTWGGSDHWWYEIEPDAHWQTHWRGDTTPRSQLLLGTRFKPEPPPPEVDELGEVERRQRSAESRPHVLRQVERAATGRGPTKVLRRRMFYVDYNWIVRSRRPVQCLHSTRLVSISR